jgi:hypothetical protein
VIGRLPFDLRAFPGAFRAPIIFRDRRQFGHG